MGVTLRNIHTLPCKPCEDVKIPDATAKGKEAKPKDKFFPLPGAKKAPGNKNHGKGHEPKPCPNGDKDLGDLLIHGRENFFRPLPKNLDPKKPLSLEKFLKQHPHPKKEELKKFLDEYLNFQSHVPNLLWEYVGDIRKEPLKTN